MIKKYYRKATIVEAVKFMRNNVEEIARWLGRKNVYPLLDYWGYVYSLEIFTKSGKKKAKMGDFIVKSGDGEIYPCKPDVFERTYEEMKEEEPLIDVDDDTMYFGFPTTKDCVGVEVCEDIIVHVDTEKEEVVVFKILHWSKFKEKIFSKGGKNGNG